MLFTFAMLLALIALGAFALPFFARVRQLNAASLRISTLPAEDRYRPMLRLLSDEDSEVVGSDKALARKFRAGRVRIFRQYLRCLTKDYGRLLAAIRFTMVNSLTDRPDLAKALLVNKMHFAMAMCRIEFRVRLYEAGIGKVDVSGLVEAMDMLRTQISFPALARIPA